MSIRDRLFWEEQHDNMIAPDRPMCVACGVEKVAPSATRCRGCEADAAYTPRRFRAWCKEQ